MLLPPPLRAAGGRQCGGLNTPAFSVHPSIHPAEGRCHRRMRPQTRPRSGGTLPPDPGRVQARQGGVQGGAALGHQDERLHEVNNTAAAVRGCCQAQRASPVPVRRARVVVGYGRGVDHLDARHRERQPQRRRGSAKQAAAVPQPALQHAPLRSTAALRRGTCLEVAARRLRVRRSVGHGRLHDSTRLAHPAHDHGPAAAAAGARR